MSGAFARKLDAPQALLAAVCSVPSRLTVRVVAVPQASQLNVRSLSPLVNMIGFAAPRIIGS